MPANAFILATKAMPASLNGERSRAFCFAHLLNLLESCSMCSPNHDGLDWFRHWLRSECELIFECHPEQDPHHSRSVLKVRHYAQCPHKGSGHRPDMGILQHSWTPALLIQELTRNSRLARHLQSWCTRATTRFAQVQSAVRPQPKFQVEE